MLTVRKTSMGTLSGRSIEPLVADCLLAGRPFSVICIQTTVLSPPMIAKPAPTIAPDYAVGWGDAAPN
jgi:hypothetical protein